MYITHEELCQAADYMVTEYENTSKWNLLKRYSISIKIATVEAIITWIEQRMKAEMEDNPRCTCGQPHIDERLN